MLNVPNEEYSPQKSKGVQRSSHIQRPQAVFDDEVGSIHFERELSFVSAVNYILNYVIGVGIFSSPGTILGQCGSVGMSFVIWSLCGFIMFLTNLPFAELCTVVPKTGSQYIYIHEAFKDFHPFFGHTPGFIFVWINFIFLRPITSAIHSIISANYMWAILAPAFSSDFESKFSFVVKNSIGALLLFLMGLINCHSIKTYAVSLDFIVTMKMMLCLSLILAGAYTFLSEQAVEFDMGFKNTTLTIQKLPVVLFTGLYAFDGAATITGALEEIENPDRTVLRSLIMGHVIVSASYLLLNLSFLSVLTPSEMVSSTAVAQVFTDKLLGPKVAFIVSVCVSLSTVGANLSGIFYSARLGYAAAKEGHMLQFLCYIHKTRLTPTPAVIFQVALSLLFFVIGKRTENLVNAYSFVLWLYYGFTMAALVILRVKKPDAHRPFKIPIVIPWVVLVISWGLVVCSFITQPIMAYIDALVVIAAGVLIQYIVVFKKKRIWGLAKVTKLLQDWLDVVPPSHQ